MRRFRTLVALFAAGALVLAACGDDGDTSADTTGTTEAEATTDDTMDDTMDDAMAADDGMDDGMAADDGMDDGMAEAPGGDTVVDVAAGNPDFSILVAAVTEAGLVETLSSDGPFTVFAPTDAAFEEALESLGITADELLANPALGDILTYHVLSGEVRAGDLEPEQTVETVQGEEATIVVDDAGARIEGANIVETDIEASNGVIHVIDSVILPPSVASELGV